MLLVKAKIGPSKIQGIGVFADQFIPKGTLIWEFTPGFDIEMTEAEVAQLPHPARASFLHYCYKDNETDRYILCSDNARFFNHSEAPNTDEDYATQDIIKGEELTYNYREHDADYYRKFSIIKYLNQFEINNLPNQ